MPDVSGLVILIQSESKSAFEQLNMSWLCLSGHHCVKSHCIAI